MRGVQGGGVPPEVHYHLHSFEYVELQVVVTAPDSQLLNPLSVSRLVSILDEADECGVVCIPQELDRGVFRCAVIGVEHRSLTGGPRSGYGPRSHPIRTRTYSQKRRLRFKT